MTKHIYLYEIVVFVFGLTIEEAILTEYGRWGTSRDAAPKIHPKSIFQQYFSHLKSENFPSVEFL